MKNFFRLLIFILAFQMEVRVRASADVIEQPVACLKSKETCAIQVTSAGFHVENKNVKLHAGSGAALVRVSENDWRLVRGALWIEQGSEVKVETLYADLAATQGQYWVIEQGNKILVRNINAELTVTLRDGKKLQLPEGFQFWIAGINSKSKNEFGMLEPISMKEHLPLWNSLYRGNKESFVKEVTHLRENWGDLTEKSSLIYRDIVDREIASEKAEQKAAEARRARKAAEVLEMKRLYHQRVFER